MPLPAALLAPIISAGAGLLGTGINAASTGRMNHKTRHWNEKMYSWQRRDALADFHMQNQYNSPEAQMQRLKSAGLNPNLVYGSGAVANSSSAPRSAQAPSWNPQAPQIDLSSVGSAFGQYFDAQVKQAQINNLAVQEEILKQDLKNKQASEFKIYAETANKNLDSAGKEIKNRYAPEIAQMSLDGMRASIEKATAETIKTRTSTQVMIDANERAKIQQGWTIKQAAESILRSRQERLRIQADILKKQVETAHEYDKNIKTIQEVRNLQQQQLHIEKQIQNLENIKTQNKEKARILETTPDWNDARAIGMLENLLGSLFQQGSYMNPKTYQGWRR